MGMLVATSPIRLPLWDRALNGAHYFRVGHSLPLEAVPRRNAASAIPRNAPCARTQASGARRKVLIVEDHPALQRAMSEHVAGMDFDVMIASHYAAARAHLASSTPDLVCVDVTLPTESGHELCEYIRGPLGLTRLPILVTSDFGSPADIAHAEEAGANAFLVKRFSMPQLGAKITALLDRVRPGTAQVIQLDELRAAHRSAKAPFEGQSARHARPAGVGAR